MFQCYYLKSSQPRLLPQNPKVCSLHLWREAVLILKVLLLIFVEILSFQNPLEPLFVVSGSFSGAMPRLLLTSGIPQWRSLANHPIPHIPTPNLSQCTYGFFPLLDLSVNCSTQSMVLIELIGVRLGQRAPIPAPVPMAQKCTMTLSTKMAIGNSSYLCMHVPSSHQEMDTVSPSLESGLPGLT